MNEELQSTNEELETTNTELRVRSDELNTANAFLGSILSGLEVAVIVVDPKLQVLAWNHRAEDLWGLRANEVQGRHLMNLDIGLPVEQLLQPVRAVLAGETERAELTLECRNRRGKSISCPIRCTPLTAGSEALGAYSADGRGSAGLLNHGLRVSPGLGLGLSVVATWSSSTAARYQPAAPAPARNRVRRLPPPSIRTGSFCRRRPLLTR
jgi:PAS domain S-box-containing protein